MDDLEMIGIIAIVNMMVSVGIILFVVFTQPPDDSLAPCYVGVISFVVLGIIEFICWLLHIPEWIGRALSWIHEKTEPKE